MSRLPYRLCVCRERSRWLLIQKLHWVKAHPDLVMTSTEGMLHAGFQSSEAPHAFMCILRESATLLIPLCNLPKHLFNTSQCMRSEASVTWKRNLLFVQVSFCGLKGHTIRDSIWASLHPLLHALLSSGCVVDV